jgi:hypothetical protein
MIGEFLARGLVFPSPTGMGMRMDPTNEMMLGGVSELTHRNNPRLSRRVAENW